LVELVDEESDEPLPLVEPFVLFCCCCICSYHCSSCCWTSELVLVPESVPSVLVSVDVD